MEYLSEKNAEDTLNSMSNAFKKIFAAIGDGRIDRDMRELGSLEKFQIRGMKCQEFAKIANRARCRFVNLTEDGKAMKLKEGDWVFDKEFFGIKFSIEETYFLHKTRFDKVGEPGREIKIRKYIEVKGGRRGYGLGHWNKNKISELIKDNKSKDIQDIVNKKLDAADEEVKKWKEMCDKEGNK